MIPGSRGPEAGGLRAGELGLGAGEGFRRLSGVLGRLRRQGWHLGVC